MTEVRRKRAIDAATALGRVESGMTVAIGGFINSGHPMALVRQIIKDETRDLTVVGAASAGLEIDMLVAAGCARRIIAPYVGAEGLAPIAPAFRMAAQEGAIEVIELDEALYYAGLRAAAQGLPFNPWRAGIGTSLPEVNPTLRAFQDPIRGEPLLAVPAIEVDVALIHAAGSDVYGNVQHNGTRYGDVAIAEAADATVVSVERILSPEDVRRDPRATSIPGADAIVRAPFGAHPFSSDGFYPPDTQHIALYLRAATEWLKTGRRNALDEYLAEFVLTPFDHVDYLERVGFRSILELSEYS